MIETLTRHPLTRPAALLVVAVAARLSHWKGAQDKAGLVLKLFLGCYLLGLGVLFAGRVLDYRNATEIAVEDAGETLLGTLPSVIPLVFEGLGFVLALAAFVLSLWVRPSGSVGGRVNQLME